MQLVIKRRLASMLSNSGANLHVSLKWKVIRIRIRAECASFMQKARFRYRAFRVLPLPFCVSATPRSTIHLPRQFERLLSAIF